MNSLQAEIKVTTKFKLAARKLFSLAYDIPYVAAVSTIKKQFPKFQPNQAIHWLNLVDRCNEHLDAPAVISPEEEIQQACQTLVSAGMVKTKIEWFLGYTSHWSFNRSSCGTIGYSTTRQQFFFTLGRNGNMFYYNNAKTAVEAFLHGNRRNLAAAV